MSYGRKTRSIKGGTRRRGGRSRRGSKRRGRGRGKRLKTYTRARGGIRL